MLKRIVTLLAASIVAISTSATAAPSADDRSFAFDELRTPDWILRATTNLNWKQGDGQYPVVDSIECVGDGSQFSFTMDSRTDLSWLQMNFLGAPVDDLHKVYTGDHLWLYVDGERWEYAQIPAHTYQLSNVDYPPSEQTEIIGVWNGHRAVRRTEGEPWLNLRLIYRRLIEAKKLEWSFKSRASRVIDKTIAENLLPKGWRHTRYRINNSGLAKAVAWCAERVASQRAYVLPDRIRSKLTPATK